MCTCVYMHVYIYIYIHREREIYRCIMLTPGLDRRQLLQTLARGTLARRRPQAVPGQLEGRGLLSLSLSLSLSLFNCWSFGLSSSCH